ncbi:hypothetical protein BDZ88DRAFT_279005 [Geranomyces variabilis]|nr:hypothetical protein BDZ88DRAFT_279005 [Geranomyces variabilis]KAJ3142392.1 hypothetical protein HDU90_004665 [Geranomyces variabilis]
MKRRYSDIQNCQASQQWLASKFGAGGAPALAGFKAKSPRKPKIPCQGFSIDSDAQCTNRTHHRTTNGPTFALCPRHDNDFMRAALKLAASVEAHGLGALLRSRNDDGSLLRMAATTWCRRGPPAKSVAGGFVYFYEHTGKSMSRAMYMSARALTVFVCAGARADVDLAGGTMVKVGADHAEKDDDTEERISKHEKAPCRAEINRCFISDYASEVAAMEKLAHDLLSPLRVPPEDVDCPCAQQHKEYFQDIDETWSLMVVTGISSGSPNKWQTMVFRVFFIFIFCFFAIL